MNEMIERVARALGPEWFGREPEAIVSNYPGQTATMRDGYRVMARAALEAMREPTDAMIQAGEIYSDSNAAWRTWEAMIDKAIEPHPRFP